MAKIYKKIIWEKPEKLKEKEFKINIPKEYQQILPIGRDKQDWHAYHLAKTQEKRLFYKLLHELCKTINEPEITYNGRPRTDLRSLVFSLVLKLYTQQCGRVLQSDLIMAKEARYIIRAPATNTLNDFMNLPAVSDLLSKLITISAIPLKELEDQYSIDASGFGTSQYDRWQVAKYKNKKGFKNYLKGHIVIGTRTNIICSCSVTPGTLHDSKQANMLIHKTGANFNIKEFSGDKAYSSGKILKAVESFGAIPFIPFKSNTTGKNKDSPQIWRDMFKFFKERREEFEHHYHKRSNVETVFSMVKKRHGEFLKCKNFIAQRNELFAKFICHNVCVLIQEMFERGVKINFRECLNEYVEVDIEDDYSKTAEKTYLLKN